MDFGARYLFRLFFLQPRLRYRGQIAGDFLRGSIQHLNAMLQKVVPSPNHRDLVIHYTNPTCERGRKRIPRLRVGLVLTGVGKTPSLTRRVGADWSSSPRFGLVG